MKKHTDIPSQEAFFYLLRCGLWEKSFDLPACFPLTVGQWEDVYRIAGQQTVRGLVFRGICLMPEAALPADGMLARWAACTDGIERKNRQMNRTLVDLCGRFCAAGLHPVVLKGQGMARFYAEPLLRECGDIDLYFPQPGQRQRAERLLQEAGVSLCRHADGSTSYSWQGTVVEHHPSACDLQSGAALRFWRQMEQLHGFHEISLLPGRPTPSVMIPAPALNWVLMNSHILKHTLGRGIGLRQLCDLARFSSSLGAAADEEELRRICRLAGITRWTHLLQSFLVECLGLPAHQLPLPVCPMEVSPLLVRIWCGGNFGQYRDGCDRPAGLWSRKLQTAVSFLQNVGFACRYAPREAVLTFIRLLKGQRG